MKFFSLQYDVEERDVAEPEKNVEWCFAIFYVLI